jgi:hypothetical protein
MPNLIPQDMREWMRRMEFKVNDLTRRMSSLIPGDIADGVNLNDYKSTGRWRRPSTVGTTTGLNYPFAGASGTLEVYWEPTNPQVHQIWYDRAGSIWTRWWNNVSWSAWHPSDKSGLPTQVGATVNPTQNIVSGTVSPLPTPVSATLLVPPGSHLIRGSVSALFGSSLAFAPSASATIRYWLSGALTFQPTQLEAAIGGVDQPIGNGGGTLTFVHEVTVATATNLTIEARGYLHAGASVTVRGVRVQLAIERRN